MNLGDGKVQDYLQHNIAISKFDDIDIDISSPFIFKIFLSKHGCDQKSKISKWFEIGIKEKDPINQEEDDWGGKIEFGQAFCKDLQGLFLVLSKVILPK